MSKLFSTCLLVQDDSSSLEFLKTEVNLHPGMVFPPDQGKSILLAGGFSSICPESALPLSPTLQLNSDLTAASIDDLEKIARAELGRTSRVNYRSYAVEANTRICVISSNAKKLQSFVDVYGGLLDIYPLLTKGFNPDIPTALELKISKTAGGCLLEYQTRSPIDLSRCTYCGECGPACPESCISENLYVDFNRCTLCKECEKVCQAEAIDIHSAVVELLNVPAVLMLDEGEIGAADVQGNIFTEKDLSRYLETIYPCQVDEVVSCADSICQHGSRPGVGCRICLQSCQYGALSYQKDSICVDPVKCVECGSCVSACPTGALQNERFDDESFLQYIHEVGLPSETTVVLGNEKSLHSFWWHQQKADFTNTFFLQYENVQSLSLFHLIYLLDRGAGRIIVIDEELDHGKELTKQVNFCNKIISTLFKVGDVVFELPVKQVASQLQLPVVGGLGSSLEKNQGFQNRRKVLGRSLQNMLQRSGETVSLSAEESKTLGIAQIVCDPDKCTHCMACINDCQIQALQAKEDEYLLNHLGMMCVGCAICIRVCPEDALAFSAEVTLDPEFFEPVELAKADPMHCKKCGKVFGTKKSYERVMTILQQKEAVDTSHFEYCETCRVVNLFEAE